MFGEVQLEKTRRKYRFSWLIWNVNSIIDLNDQSSPIETETSSDFKLKFHIEDILLLKKEIFNQIFHPFNLPITS